jgi:hypothetical protein
MSVPTTISRFWPRQTWIWDDLSVMAASSRPWAAKKKGLKAWLWPRFSLHGDDQPAIACEGTSPVRAFFLENRPGERNFKSQTFNKKNRVLSTS